MNKIVGCPSSFVNRIGPALEILPFEAREAQGTLRANVTSRFSELLLIPPKDDRESILATVSPGGVAMAAKSINIHVWFLPAEYKQIQRHVAKFGDPWTISASLRHETVAAVRRALPGTKRIPAKRTRTT